MATRIRRKGLRDRLPEGAMLITRASRYGNPFKIDRVCEYGGGMPPRSGWIIVDVRIERMGRLDCVVSEHGDRMSARAEAVRLFRE